MSDLRYTLGALVLGLSVGAAAPAIADIDVRDAMLAVIDGVSTERVDLSTSRRRMTLSMRADPKPEAAALGYTGGSWTEGRYCPASADDEIAALLAACSVVDNVARPAILFAKGEERTRIVCDGAGVCTEAVVDVPNP